MSSISTRSAWSKKVGFILFFLMLAYAAQAQILQSGRLELPINDDQFDKLRAVNLAENGLMLYHRITGKNEDQLELIKLDTALMENWKGFIPFSKNLNLMRLQYHGEKLFLLLKDRYYVGGDFLIVAVKLSNGNYESYTVKNLIPFNPTEFIIGNKAVLIGGYFNNTPIVLYYNLALQQSKVLPGFFSAPGELNQLKSYDDGSIDIIVSTRNLEKRRCLWIRNYNPDGDLVKTTVLEPSEGKNLIFGRSTKLPSGEQIVAGVYGRYTEYSRGIFLASIDSTGASAVRYYNFAEFHNFFSFMRARRQKRVKDRIERKTILGKKVKFSYRFIIHDIIPYHNQYILTGESFYPHYSYPNQYSNNYRSNPYSLTTQGFYSNPFIRSDLIFDGYQYTHAVMIGFDASGKPRWDNSFEINDVRTMQLDQFVKVRPEKDRIILMYLFRNTLRTKIIRDEEVLEGKNQEVMKTNYANETVEARSIEFEQLDYWYGRYFYAYGIQRLKHQVGTTRRVFFINKITYK